ncbi:hypothetical protein J7354_01335 [Sulfitobacter sp. R18_2]|uniref:hypothetical protein n=1 Tax=Sulfitobacter sp. R18_2 TaxID=2821105 RepID=UPI001AD9E487|nr:hypothetical protein [Sulfitobacter sp. R18_2]MBO9437293.1 hypothetical protein [Sulfitobacter sp. R18_2]
MSNALDDLIEKVEGGKATHADFQAAAYVLEGFHGRAQEAYEEHCLTAACVVHEEMLPDWEWEVSNHGGTEGRSAVQLQVKGDPQDREWVWGIDAIPARAWLIAILKAMKEGKDDGSL